MFGTKRNDTIQDKAEDFLEDAGKSISEFGREARHKADGAKKDMVKTLYSAAHTIRKEAREANASKDVREHADGVAKGFERAAHYLKKNSYEDIGDDVVEGVRANPWRTLAIIFIVGLVIGLLLRGGDQPQPQVQDNYRRP
ncbi:MAG: hypothetical protein IAE80_06400 [Anaerolinea sp.]|nr:hypothetical protein [Anaerolinea sp.]